MERMRLPNTRAYDEAGKGKHSLFSVEHCCICGHTARGDKWLLLFRDSDGSAEYAISGTTGLTAEEKRSIWIAPIGPECLKQHPELRFALLVTADALDSMRRRVMLALVEYTSDAERIANEVYAEAIREGK